VLKERGEELLGERKIEQVNERRPDQDHEPVLVREVYDLEDRVIV
jgi:hypothetical protein